MVWMGCRVADGAGPNDGAADPHEARDPADVAYDPSPYFKNSAPFTPTEGLAPVEAPPQFGIPGPEDQVEKIDQFLPFAIGADL
jgi:hypothetical protein